MEFILSYGISLSYVSLVDFCAAVNPRDVFRGWIKKYKEGGREIIFVVDVYDKVISLPSSTFGGNHYKKRVKRSDVK